MKTQVTKFNYLTDVDLIRISGGYHVMLGSSGSDARHYVNDHFSDITIGDLMPKQLLYP